MLQKLNERIQGVVAWLVVILIAITFMMFGVDYYVQSHQTSNAKVVVNDQALSTQTFETNYRRLRAQQDMATMTAADEKKLQNQVIDQMVTNEVSLQAARHYGFEVTPDEANAAIVNIPQFQEDGHFSSQKYQQALSGALFTPETFQNEVRQGMLLNQQRFAFMASSFALPNEIKRFVRLYMQTRDYDYLTIPEAQFESSIQVTPEQINAYYKEHQKEFMSPEQVSLEYVTLSMHDIRSAIKINDEEVARYYEENKNNYLTPAQWQVAHILFSVPEGATEEELTQIQEKAEATYESLEKNPETFEKLVAELSDDKLSVADKGVLPWITAGQKEYDGILATLSKPGQISKPEKTNHGFEIFKLIAYKPVTTKSKKDVAAMIKEQMINEQAQAKYAQALEQLSDLSYQSPDSLVPAADTLKLKIQKTELFTHEGGTTPITQNKLITNAAFNHDVLALGNNSEPIQLDSDSVAVVRVAKHLPSKEQELAQVQDQIKHTLIKQGAEAKAKEIGTNLLNPIDDKAQLDLISANKLEWKSVTAATRDNDKEKTLVNDLAFNLLRPESREGASLEEGDYVVVRLKHVNYGTVEALDKEHYDSLVQQIEASYGMMDYDLYVSNLMSKAKVVRN